MTAPELFTKHRRIARAIARDFYLPGSEREDVEQEAMIGLWFACRSYDAETGASFASFAALVIRRRLTSLLVAALRGKHEPLTRSVRTALLEDGTEVAIVDVLAGGRDPFEVVVAREAFERLCAATGRLTKLERQALDVVLAGEPYSHEKRLDNAVVRTRRKLREAA